MSQGGTAHGAQIRMAKGRWKQCSWDSRFRPEQSSPLPLMPSIGLSPATPEGPLGTLPFPGHDPKSFTRVPAPAAFPSQDFALIWRFPELVGGNWTLLGSDCISGWGHRRRHLAWLLGDQGGCPLTCPPSACSWFVPAPLLPGTLFFCSGLLCPSLCITDIQALDREGAGRARPTAKPKAVCSQGTHSIASSAASWQGDTELQGADSSGAESPPEPLALELMPAGEVNLGTGIPGGRCEVQPESCQYILRED